MPPGAIVLSQTRQIEPVQGSEGPPADLLETLGGAFTSARADTTGRAMDVELEAYMEVAREIERMGGAKAYTFVNPRTGLVDGDGVWRAMEQQRQRGSFKNLPRTREDFDEQWKARERERIAKASRTAARGNPAVAFAGGMAGAMTDPVNLISLPLGGFGKTLATRVISEAVVGASVEAVMQPGINRQREALGRESLTGEEAMQNILFAGAGAAVLRGGFEIGSKHWGSIKAAPKEVQEKAWATILDRTPGLRERIGSKIDWNALDDHLPDIADNLIPPERMTDAERGAIAAMRRDAEISTANPFVPDGAGAESYTRLLADAMQGIMNEAPAYVPKVRPSPGARLRGGTAIATQITGDAIATVKARIGVVESGGSATAKNPRSSARGLYQFTDGTWLAYYERRFGTQGLTREQILAKKTDTGLQNTLMDDLLSDNMRALVQGGQAADAGNLYLAHFAGRKGALDLLTAEPNTPVARVLGQRAVDANPFLRGMTASDVVAWAHRKMGGASAPQTAARAPETGMESDPFAALDRELADTRAQIERIDGELEAGAVRPPREDDDAELPRPIAEAEAPSRTDPIDPPAELPESVQAAIPPLRDVIDRQSRSLNDVEGLSNDLGVSEADLRAALTELAQRGDITMKIPRELRKRVPNARGRMRWQTDAEVLADRGGVWDGDFSRPSLRGEDDLVAAIARRGGLSEDGFSAAQRARNATMDNPPRGHDLRNTGNIGGHFVPGAGPLVRKSGRGVDELVEDLHDEGFFGPPEVTPRPTEAEFIAMLDQTILRGERIYPTRIENAADARAANVRDAFFEPQIEEFRKLWADYGLDPDDLPEAMVSRAAARWADGEGLSPEQVIGQMVREDFEDTLRLAVDEEMEAKYGRDYDPFDPAQGDEFQRRFDALRYEAGYVADADGYFADGSNVFGPGEVEGPAGGRGAGGAQPARAGPGAEESGPLDPDSWQGWDEPDGPAAKITVDSMEHDARAILDRGDEPDPAATARQGQETQLRADAPMRGENRTGQAQDGTMGLGLFDAADQPMFRMDEEGEAISGADMLADFETDAAFIQTVKDCL